jgi:uncharacterized protein (DUF2235 family)
MKNIVLCCDGTNNQFDGDHTNVTRAYQVACHLGSQLTFYDPGVGTMPEPWQTTRLAKRWSVLKGLAFGSGFMRNIGDAYAFLMDTYEPGDQVFLFGFSRGAFTARAVAAMLHSVGLLLPGSKNLIPYAQRYWRDDLRKDTGDDTPGAKVCAEFKQTMARECPVHFIGVWDTVSSVGLINLFQTFPWTYKNPIVSHVRHAVAIDERRSCFRQNLMMPAFAGQDVINVWFPGVHSDVGGGYPAQEAGLAKVAFEWMMREAGLCGMHIDASALKHQMHQAGASPDPCADRHESLKGGWRLVELIPVRRYNWTSGKNEWRWPLGSPRNIQRNAGEPHVRLHHSVITRLKGRNDYQPPNLPKDDPTLGGKLAIEK